MNNYNAIGRLVREPELDTYGKDKRPYLRNTIAINNGGDNTDFVPFTAFGKTAEIIDQYCKKGDMIALSGHLTSGSYDKDGETVYTLNVTVERVHLLPNSAKEEKSKSGKYRK